MESIQEQIRKLVNRKEIFRYLGYGARVPDDNVAALVEDVLEHLIQGMTPRHVYQVYDCHILHNQVILSEVHTGKSVRSITFVSSNLAENLRQCGKTALIAATLGIEADKLLHRYEMINMAKASAAQACGAACIEAYCNILQELICSEASDIFGRRFYIRPRFSPGYGDLALVNQKAVFGALECTKRIGLTLTDNLLMYPTKSVTAFIGLADSSQDCSAKNCDRCSNITCGLRVQE